MIDRITQINPSPNKDFIPQQEKQAWQRTSWISLSKMKPRNYNLFLEETLWFYLVYRFERLKFKDNLKDKI